MAKTYGQIEKETGVNRSILWNVEHVAHSGNAMSFDDIRAAVKCGGFSLPRSSGDREIKTALTYFGWKNSDKDANLWYPPAA